MDTRTISAAVAEFSAKFCNELDKSKNIVSSPLSAEFVLALLTLGTTDPAHSELLTSLGISGDDEIRSSFSTVLTKLKSIKGVTLNVANKVYINEGDYDLDAELKEDAINVFDAALEKLDFSKSAEATKLINDWVESKTNGKIKDLLPPGCVNAGTCLVLLNAIYFKGSWKKKFNSNYTLDKPFFLDEETTVTIPMMCKEDDYFYGRSDALNAQLLKIPYEGDQTSMFIVLPNDITGLDAVMAKLASGHDLISEMDKMHKTKVQVTLPKFKIETEIDLAQVLPKLGIKSIFNRYNSGITKILNKSESLYVSKAIQKAFIEVNEEGAEAAAATVFILLIQPIYSSNMDTRTISSAVAEFSAKFCNELDKSKSIVSSPLSAEFVLALLTLGTTDPAHSELLTSLGISGDDAIRSSFSVVSANLKSIKGVTLNVANKVYIKEGDYDLDAELKEDAIKVFDAALEKIDFGENVVAAKLINDWVESKTNGKIKDLLSSDSLNADSRLVLLNAIYFKGSWKNKFNSNFTSDMPFFLDEETTVTIPMMYKEDDYFYGHSDALNAQLLKIPYEGDQTSMFIVLPNDITGLDAVMAKLASGHDLLSEMDKMHKTKVQVTIPKFKIETEIDLAEVLPKLGIKSIFNVNNSGITKILNTSEPLYVSKAIQKAFIEVNEEGAEAAAATAMGIMFCSAIIGEPSVPTFVADRPFLAAVVADDTIYFTAVYRGN